MGYDVNARRDLNGIPVNLIKDPTTLLLTEWKGETYGYVWNTDTLAWEKAQQSVLNAIGSEINVNLGDVEANQTNGTQRVRITDGTDEAEVTPEGNLNISIGDGSNLDAFSRLRTSEPVGIFDSTFQYDLQPIIYHAITASSGTITHDANRVSANLTVTSTNGSLAYLQSKQYHRYIPAKSQLIVLTQVVGVATANVRKRIGYFDSANGIFLEQNGTADIAIVRRSSVSGSVVDTRVTKSNWNINTLSNLDLSKASILVIDLQWLGMGRVRVGFDIDGCIHYAHEFLNANNLDVPYMQTANLPVRWEIQSTATSAGATMYATCASVISEGGIEADRGYHFSAANTSDVTVTTSRTHTISIRPKAVFPDASAIVNRIQILINEYSVLAGNNSVLLEVIYNPTLTGGSWASAGSGSAVEINTGATYTASSGTVIDSFFVSSSAANRGSGNDDAYAQRIPIVLDHLGANPIPLSLVATATVGTSACRARISWKELR